jgi:hypothetical protein
MPLVGLGILAGSTGDHEVAERYQLETRDLGFALGNGVLIGLAEAQLGFTHVATGRTSEAGAPCAVPSTCSGR